MTSAYAFILVSLFQVSPTALSILSTELGTVGITPVISLTCSHISLDPFLLGDPNFTLSFQTAYPVFLCWYGIACVVRLILCLTNVMAGSR